jgi:hypothetical protein
MAQTQIADVIVPAEFTAYQVENSLESTALFRSRVSRISTGLSIRENSKLWRV